MGVWKWGLRLVSSDAGRFLDCVGLTKQSTLTSPLIDGFDKLEKQIL
jgi:hypothetical protein